MTAQGAEQGVAAILSQAAPSESRAAWATALAMSLTAGDPILFAEPSQVSASSTISFLAGHSLQSFVIAQREAAQGIVTVAFAGE
jgi:hypothetical protein